MAMIIIVVILDEEWKRPESENQAEDSEAFSRFCKLFESYLYSARVETAIPSFNLQPDLSQGKRTF